MPFLRIITLHLLLVLFKLLCQEESLVITASILFLLHLRSNSGIHVFDMHVAASSSSKGQQTLVFELQFQSQRLILRRAWTSLGPASTAQQGTRRARRHSLLLVILQSRLGTSGNLIQIKVRCSREKEKLGSLLWVEGGSLQRIARCVEIEAELQKLLQSQAALRIAPQRLTHRIAAELVRGLQLRQLIGATGILGIGQSLPLLLHLHVGRVEENGHRDASALDLWHLRDAMPLRAEDYEVAVLKEQRRLVDRQNAFVAE
mmetsp:Transcript_55699/g.133287  ORF Transcript_55699/g.133287 Transcript_55699/m.133287 type:complete len:260 (+) Transcript_55699:1145-1924(+)